MISLWIQRADFQSQQWAVATAGDAVASFEGHDWAGELRYRDELEARADEWCAPGLGLADDRGRVLHFCPRDAAVADVHYHYQAWHRWLGIVPVAKDVVATVESVPLREVPALIDRFFARQHEWLERRFATR